MAATRYGQLRNEIMRQSFPSIFAPVVLRDADSNYVPIPISERLAQCIWYDQRIQTDQLRTTDGRAVRVVFPGWWNLEAGPDFRHATVQVGDEPERTGDVEIHLRADDWSHHGHQRDPLYDGVILHVVLWEPHSATSVKTRAGDVLPQLVLQHHLAAQLESLYDEIDLDAYPYGVGRHGKSCAHMVTNFSEAAIGALLDAAGDERFAIKTRKFSRRIHRVGADQAFYEGWMEALGYKTNKAAFRALAQRLPVAMVGADSVHDTRAGRWDALAALLFGVANFLPTAAPTGRDASSRQYVKRLWGKWWKLRPDFEERILPVTAWNLHGIRPANHPHRRLGAAVALLRKHRNFLEKVTGAIESDGDPAKLFLQVRDPYWSRHFTLGGKTQPREVELVGESRAQEIAANVVLPFVAALAESEGHRRLRGKSETRYTALRSSPSNSLLRLAAHQLFHGKSPGLRFINSTRRQQGLMQIFHDFCLNDKSACQQCQFPELVKRWSTAGMFPVG
jgi:hypothetical protein